VLGLEQFLQSLPGMVDQHLAEHPAAWAGSAQYVIPRSLLPAFRQERRAKRDELREKYDRPHEEWSGEELLEQGMQRCLLLLQCCTSPVHLQSTSSPPPVHLQSTSSPPPVHLKYKKKYR